MPPCRTAGRPDRRTMRSPCSWHRPALGSTRVRGEAQHSGLSTSQCKAKYRGRTLPLAQLIERSNSFEWSLFSAPVPLPVPSRGEYPTPVDVAVGCGGVEKKNWGGCSWSQMATKRSYGPIMPLELLPFLDPRWSCGRALLWPVWASRRPGVLPIRCCWVLTLPPGPGHLSTLAIVPRPLGVHRLSSPEGPAGLSALSLRPRRTQRCGQRRSQPAGAAEAGTLLPCSVKYGRWP